MQTEQSTQKEVSQFKEGDRVLYTPPRRRFGISLRPEYGIVSKFYSRNYILIELRCGTKKQVKPYNLRLAP